MKLVEDRELYSGIFWILDPENIDSSAEYCFFIPTSPDGEVENDGSLNAKSGLTYNHERLWNSLSRTQTHGKTFDYYPRGRVQIKNGRAHIYYNPHLDEYEDFRPFIVDQFNLTEYNGIRDIKWHPDFSEHYRCHLD